MRRPTRTTLGILAAAAVVTAAGAATGTAARPAPEPFPTVGTYRGELIDSEVLVTSGLACTLVVGILSCYDSRADARAAATTRLERAGVPSCSPPLEVWWDGGFQGGSLAYYDHPGWQALPDAWLGQVSSWRSGCRPGRLSASSAGGVPTIGLPPGGLAGVMPAGWNDRAGAIYRG
jgi:hypothetical protein